MADITSRVKFIGDAQQLLATYKTIGAQAEALQRQIDRTTNRNFRARGLNPIANNDSRTVGPVAKNIQTELDSLNKTFVTSAKTAIRYKDALGNIRETLTGTVTRVHGDTVLLEQVARKYNGTLSRGIGLEQARVKQVQNSLGALRELRSVELQRAEAARAFIKTQESSGIIDSGTARYLQRRNQDILTKNLATDPNIAQAKRQYEQDLNKLINLRQRISVANAAVANALEAPPPIPAQIQQLGTLSPRLLQQLQKSGLGTDAATLYRQNPQISFYKDLEKQVTRINGSFTDLGTGIDQHFNAQLDKSGKLITRFGGQLSGLQNFLDQTVRNLQKVVQWGVATTVVFGGLALAARELDVITTLDKNLNRLAVTANLTRDQANGLFNELADIGIRTATPLGEITASADDIALAVRDTSTSVDDFRQNILNLTEAVGIYTNLTGQDTVEATDLLTSAMKQLNLQSEDVTGLLSKITAVSGGQSQAISDVTEGLAAMAEAARNAGLSVDRTLATVQVLSQVTAKSPSEVATAFKNLVGALENPAGIKQLQALNIALVSQGNNIIDIYSEIAEKIRTGVIASTEVSGVLRNLAGGPRRAPDAAALLSNIDKIAAVEGRSVRATNEALIVNAKVLDTIQAKITQLQAKFDKFIFSKFGQGFKDAVGTIVDVAGKLLDVIGEIPSGFVSAGIQLALFLVAIRLGIGLIRTFAGVATGLGVALKETAEGFKVATVASTQFTAVINGEQVTGPLATGAGGTKPTTKGFLSKLGGRGNVGSLLIGAGVGAGLGAATGGGDLKTILSGALTGGGLAALTAPVPLPWLKVGGAIALALGTLIEFVDTSDKAAEAQERQAKSAEKLLNLYQNYSEAKSSVDDLTKEQSNLQTSIFTLNKEQDKSPESLAQLADAQKQYIDNAIDMAAANQQVYDSMKDIREESPSLAAAIQGVKTGTIRPEQLEEEIQKLQLKLLQQTNPKATLPKGPQGIIRPTPAPITPYENPIGGPDERGNTAFIPSTSTTQTAFGGRGGPIQYQTRTQAGPFNLDELSTQAAKVKQLFNSTGTALIAAFEPTGKNIGLVSQALKELKDSNDPLATSLQNTFQAWVQQNSILDATADALESYQNRIDALKFFKPEQAAELQKVLDLGKQAIAFFGQKGDAKGVFDISSLLYSFVSGDKAVNQDSIKPILAAVAESQGLVNDKTLEGVDILRIYDEIVQKNALDFNYLGESGQQAVKNITAEVIAAEETLNNFVADQQASLATRSAQLQADFQAGGFKGHEKDYRGQISQINELSIALDEVKVAFKEAAEAAGNELDPAMQQLAGGLTNVNGLQDAQQLTTEQLIERMLGLADTYGLTGKQVDSLKDKMKQLLQTGEILAKLRVEFPIIANLDLKQAIAALKALRTATAAAVNSVDRKIAGPGFSNKLKQIGTLDAAIAALEKAQNLTTGGGSIPNIYLNGRGDKTFNSNKTSPTSSSKTKSAGPGLDVSNLDLPEEIANAVNRSTLIKKAIQNAKELQSKIPGATKDAKNDIVELLKGTQRVLEVRGVKDDLLRKALDELAEIEKKRLDFETKADTIRRIRVGAADFAAIANVPVNSRTGVSLGGQEGPINISLNLNGTVLTPAQFGQFADLVAASLKKQIAGG